MNNLFYKKLYCCNMKLSSIYKLLFIGMTILSIYGCGKNNGDDPVTTRSDTVPSLLFSNQPVTTSALSSFTVTVQILDSNGDLDTSAKDMVTLSLGDVRPDLLVHQSGNDPFVLELVDLKTYDQLGWFESQPGNEVGGMAFQESTDTIFYSVRGSNNFLSLNPYTDTQTLIGIGTTQYIKGMAFELNTPNRLLALSKAAPISANLPAELLRSIDPATGVTYDFGKIIPDSIIINSFNGMAIDPTMGGIYSVLNSGKGNPRYLATIDISTLDLTTLGPLNEMGGTNSVASIAFSSDGNLYAVTGDGSTDKPESLFSVNKTTGELTFLASLDIIQPVSDGEAIAIIREKLRGITTVSAVDGVATFENIKLNASATGYTIIASAINYQNVTSNAFDITPVTGTTGIVQFNAMTQMVDEAAGTVMVLVSIDAVQTHDVVVAISVGGTATDNGIDFNIDGSNFFNVTIPAGTTSNSRVITIIDDSIIEPDETVVLTIENAGLATIGSMLNHIVTITDND